MRYETALDIQTTESKTLKTRKSNFHTEIKMKLFKVTEWCLGVYMGWRVWWEGTWKFSIRRT